MSFYVYLGTAREHFNAKSYVNTCRELAKDYTKMARKYKDDYCRKEAERLRNIAKSYMNGIKEYEARNG